jgi:hypothetical protein
MMTKEEKNRELTKYRDRVFGLIELFLERGTLKIKTEDFDSDQHFIHVKEQARQFFEKGQLTRLKQFCRDLSEPIQFDAEGQRILEQKLGEHITWIKNDLDMVVDRVTKRKRINNGEEFRIVNEKVDRLTQENYLDKTTIQFLHSLLADFETKRKK